VAGVVYPLLGKEGITLLTPCLSARRCRRRGVARCERQRAGRLCRPYILNLNHAYVPAIGRECRVPGEQGQRLGECLRDKRPVEWV